MKKIAIITTHPIQYNAPWFKMLALADSVDLKVFYTWSQAKEKVKDKTFGREIKWDIPLLEGYNYEFVKNISKNPGSNQWNGIDNPDLIPKVKSFDPDSILVFGWKMKSHFKVMRYFKGKIPVWFRGDSTLIDERKGLKVYIRRLLLKNIYKYVDKAFYVGIENKKYFKSHGLNEHQLRFVPHAIDNERFFDSKEKNYEGKAKQWREELGYKENDLVILYAGKLNPVKNLPVLIDAFQEINKNAECQMKLLLVGNGSMEKDFYQISELDENIKVMPFQNQSVMPIVYRLGDVYCLPSKSETWGLAVNEAMASSRPVVISNNVGCAADLVISNSVGYIFESDNLHQLKEIISNISKKEVKQMGEDARQYIENWSFEKICQSINTEMMTLNAKDSIGI